MRFVAVASENATEAESGEAELYVRHVKLLTEMDLSAIVIGPKAALAAAREVERAV
jgi:hypothetical protein